MSRDLQTYAITLKSVNWGEMHKKITLLTQDLGVIDAVVYGARVGKLSAACEAFTFSRVFLYRQVGRDYYTLKDMEIVRELRSLRSHLSRIYAAHAMNEISLKMHGGEYQQVFSLLSDAYELLDKEDSETLQVLIQFIYRSIGIMGLAGDLETCPLCGHRYTEREVLSYNSGIHTAVCNQCSDTSQLSLYPGMRRYLVVSGSLDIASAAALELSETAGKRIFLYLRETLRDILGYSLQSLVDSTMFMIRD
ncbi:MAG: DNA repair protein RecO [Sphaerochaetaceae bacterium]|nr:DNA repair protein RecO [Sphaerochaetaceae bacterium]